MNIYYIDIEEFKQTHDKNFLSEYADKRIEKLITAKLLLIKTVNLNSKTLTCISASHIQKIMQLFALTKTSAELI